MRYPLVMLLDVKVSLGAFLLGLAELVVVQQIRPDLETQRVFDAAEVDETVNFSRVIRRYCAALVVQRLPHISCQTACSIARRELIDDVGMHKASQMCAHRSQVSTMREPAVERARRDLPFHVVAQRLY